MTERARDKDGKRQEREGKRETAGRGTRRTAGRRDRETEGERKGSRDTERGREKERKAAEKQKGQEGRWEQVGKGRGRDRDGQRQADMKQRKQLQTEMEETERHSLMPVKAVRSPGPTSGPEGLALPSPTPPRNTWPSWASRTLHVRPHLPVCLRWGSPVTMSVLFCVSAHLCPSP